MMKLDEGKQPLATGMILVQNWFEEVELLKAIFFNLAGPGVRHNPDMPLDMCFGRSPILIRN